MHLLAQTTDFDLGSFDRALAESIESTDTMISVWLWAEILGSIAITVVICIAAYKYFVRHPPVCSVCGAQLQPNGVHRWTVKGYYKYVCSACNAEALTRAGKDPIDELASIGKSTSSAPRVPWPTSFEPIPLEPPTSDPTPTGPAPVKPAVPGQRWPKRARICEVCGADAGRRGEHRWGNDGYRFVCHQCLVDGIERVDRPNQ